MSKLILKLWVPGNPQGKGRARSVALRNSDGSLKTRKTKSGKQAPVMVHMTPEKTRTYEGNIKSLAVDRIKKPAKRPVSIKLIIRMPVPDSWPAWKRSAALSGEIEPTAKPDSDNIEKAVKDALNGVAWLDDCQVTVDSKKKVYSETVGISIGVWERCTVPSTVKTKAEFEALRAGCF